MTPEEALSSIVAEFPFEGYMNRGTMDACMNIAGVVSRHLGPGSRILDFGCGPCDKTAVLKLMGYDCHGCDDMRDEWHKRSGVMEKIVSFTAKAGIDFRVTDGGLPEYEKGWFDMIMLNDVLEHLHSSPRDVLNSLLEFAKPEGFLLVTVPNAVNIRKRVDVLFGRTNMPRYEEYYWYPGEWRGHIREYVRNDLEELAGYLDLEIVELRSCDHMLQKLPGYAHGAYRMFTGIFRDCKDSWLLLAKKKAGWAARVFPDPAGGAAGISV